MDFLKSDQTGGNKSYPVCLAVTVRIKWRRRLLPWAGIIVTALMTSNNVWHILITLWHFGVYNIWYLSSKFFINSESRKWGDDDKSVFLLSSMSFQKLTMFLEDTGVSGFIFFVIYGHSFQILITGGDLCIYLVFKVALTFGLCLGSIDTVFKVRRSYVKGCWKDFTLAEKPWKQRFSVAAHVCHNLTTASLLDNYIVSSFALWWIEIEWPFWSSQSPAQCSAMLGTAQVRFWWILQ